MDSEALSGAALHTERAFFYGRIPRTYGRIPRTRRKRPHPGILDAGQKI